MRFVRRVAGVDLTNSSKSITGGRAVRWVVVVMVVVMFVAMVVAVTVVVVAVGGRGGGGRGGGAQRVQTHPHRRQHRPGLRCLQSVSLSDLFMLETVGCVKMVSIVMVLTVLVGGGVLRCVAAPSALTPAGRSR
jgi:hypothetical protein